MLLMGIYCFPKYYELNTVWYVIYPLLKKEWFFVQFFNVFRQASSSVLFSFHWSAKKIEKIREIEMITIVEFSDNYDLFICNNW